MQHEPHFGQNQLLVLNEGQSERVLLEAAAEVLLGVAHLFDLACQKQTRVHDLDRVVNEDTFFQVEPLHVRSRCTDHLQRVELVVGFNHFFDVVRQTFFFRLIGYPEVFCLFLQTNSF